MEDLKTMDDVDVLTVHIHSTGGNAYDAMTIHNRLKSMKAHVNVVVDGVAMSGGALIMCAGDNVQVFPGSLIMIHKCWAYAVGNADDLRKTADSYDAVDRSQASIFGVKTGLSTDELLSMMAEETYLTGQEAIDKGFADELVEGSALDVAASADRRTLYVGATPVWSSRRKDGIPGSVNIPVVNAGPKPGAANTNQPAQPVKEGGNPMANTIEELRQEYPELTAQLEEQARTSVNVQTAVNEAVRAEQNRLQEIDEVAGLFASDLVQAAKYGEQSCTAQELAFRAAKAAAKQGRSFLTALDDDAKASGSAQVTAAPVGGNGEDKDPKTMTKEQRMASARADVQALLGKKEEA
jgi:ATP-dependent protease ClpP protease subunit/molybdopterin converting factor small subunit